MTQSTRSNLMLYNLFEGTVADIIRVLTSMVLNLQKTLGFVSSPKELKSWWAKKDLNNFLIMSMSMFANTGVQSFNMVLRRTA